MKKILVIAVFILAVSVYSNDIVGSYSVVGKNPGGKGDYKGTLKITKTEETYLVVWGDTYIGTGILNGDVLSVAYMDKKNKWFGIISYKISDDGKKLEGEWCACGKKFLGTETATKK